MEYTGQLIGGPDNGNFVTSKVPQINCEVVYRHWLDGPNRTPIVLKVRGKYIWRTNERYFEWKP